MSHHELYSDEGAVERDPCPRCGDVFLAEHGDRRHCGRCSYTEWE